MIRHPDIAPGPEARRGIISVTGTSQDPVYETGKLLPLRRMPPYRSGADEYTGLVWDVEHVRHQLAERPGIYGHRSFTALHPWRNYKHAHGHTWVIIGRAKRSELIFRVAPLLPDGTLGKLGERFWLDRELLAMCRNLTDHLASQKKPIRAFDV